MTIDPATWWVLVIQLGVAGSMATIGSLNVQWWAQDRRERSLGLTGLLCWSVTLLLILGAVSLVFPSWQLFDVILPVRALLTGSIVCLFVGTLSAMMQRPIPGSRAAIVISLAAPAFFVAFGLFTDLAYVFVDGSEWPSFQPLGNVLISVSAAVFFGYTVMAIRMLAGIRGWQLGVSVSAALGLVGVAATHSPSLASEALTSMWTAPIGIMLAWWCSDRVLTLQGSLISAEAGRQEAERAVHFQARYDQLTGLPNQAAAIDTLQELIDEAGADDCIMVAIVQINGMEQVLAAAGVDVADVTVKRFAECLASTLPPGCALARIGESTFMFMSPQPSGLSSRRFEADSYDAVDCIHRAARLPPELTMVTGMTIATAAASANELLQQARIALTAAELGDHRLQLFSRELRDGIVGRARTVRLLNAALDRDEFELHYQPVLNAVSGVRVSVEALVRWRHHGRLHAPAEWIPIAEQQRLMPAIGVKVLQIAAADYATLGCPIAVNVSPRQFNDPHFAATVLAALGSCPPTALILEVTESSVMTDQVRANQELDLLRAHGVRIALDDFGTQYSSLSRLSTVPFDIVKIDRSFVNRVLTIDGRAMVTAIHALARALGKVTVAEGVETSMQLQAVRDIGCDLVQGYLTGRPVPLSELAATAAAVDWLTDPNTPRASAPAGPGGRLTDRSTSSSEVADLEAELDEHRYTQ